MFQKLILGSLVVSGILLACPQAEGGLWQEFYRGMDILATPSGGPVNIASDGTRFNGQRSGRLRFIPNRLGKGWDVEFDRSFGQDSSGRPETFDLGVARATLSGSLQSTLGYTSRGFLMGNADTTINNLVYNFETRNGAQDVQLTGTLNGTSTTSINQFGFYDLSLNVNNTDAALRVDGVLVDDSSTADFDIGPINIKGNIFFDGFLALLNSMGVDTSQFAAATPESPVDRINDAIEEALRKSSFDTASLKQDPFGTISDEDRIQLMAGAQTELLARLLGISPEHAGRGLEGSMDGGALTMNGDGSVQGSGGAAVPEPSALVLLVTGMAVWLRRVRR